MVSQLGNGVQYADLFEFFVVSIYCFSPLKRSMDPAFRATVILNCLNTLKFLFSLSFYIIFL